MSFLPVSLFIIGIGCEDFSMMEKLADDILINSGKREAARQIVNFVKLTNNMPQKSKQAKKD